MIARCERCAHLWITPTTDGDCCIRCGGKPRYVQLTLPPRQETVSERLQNWFYSMAIFTIAGAVAYSLWKLGGLGFGN